MASFEFKGMDDYLGQLRRLSDPAQYRNYVGKAVAAGAGIVADQIRENVRKIPTVGANERGTPENPLTGITRSQKDGLLAGFGISKMRDDDGFLNVKLGFDGYNNLKTKKYPNGQPNSLIARSVESGTSFRRKHPFIAPAIKAAKDKAETKIGETLDKEISKLMED